MATSISDNTTGNTELPGMSKKNSNNYKNSPSAPKEVSTAKGNSLEKYFGSPDTIKKRKKSSSSPNSDSPPAKRMDKSQDNTNPDPTESGREW